MLGSNQKTNCEKGIVKKCSDTCARLRGICNRHLCVLSSCLDCYFAFKNYRVWIPICSVAVRPYLLLDILAKVFGISLPFYNWFRQDLKLFLAMNLFCVSCLVWFYSHAWKVLLGIVFTFAKFHETVDKHVISHIIDISGISLYVFRLN